MWPLQVAIIMSITVPYGSFHYNSPSFGRSLNTTEYDRPYNSLFSGNPSLTLTSCDAGIIISVSLSLSIPMSITSSSNCVDILVSCELWVLPVEVCLCTPDSMLAILMSMLLLILDVAAALTPSLANVALRVRRSFSGSTLLRRPLSGGSFGRSSWIGSSLSRSFSLSWCGDVMMAMCNGTSNSGPLITTE